jgi:hypothetical protein
MENRIERTGWRRLERDDPRGIIVHDAATSGTIDDCPRRDDDVAGRTAYATVSTLPDDWAVLVLGVGGAAPALP